MVRVNGMSLPEHFIAFFDLVNTPEELSLEDEHLNIIRILLLGHLQLSECQVFVRGTDVGQGFEVDKFDVLRLNRGNQVQGIVTVALLNKCQPLHEVELVHTSLPIILMLQIQRLFELLNGRAEVAELDEDLCLFNIHLRNGLIIEEDFIELD